MSQTDVHFLSSHRGCPHTLSGVTVAGPSPLKSAFANYLFQYTDACWEEKLFIIISNDASWDGL